MNKESKSEGVVRKKRSMVYDYAFQTIAQECMDVLILFVNEMFGERYGSSAKVEHLRNEHFDQNKDKPTEKRISDAHFRITSGSHSRIYHLECESKGYGEEILIRMFRYNISHAAESTEGNPPYKLSLELPKSGVLVLRDKGNPPERMTFEIKTPNGSVSYEMPLIRMSDYSIDRIFKRKMYLLIPFYFFNLEERLKFYNENAEGLDEFEKIYTDIIERIRKEPESRLSVRSKDVIIREMVNVTKGLANDREKIVEKVGDIMGREYKKPDWLVKRDAEMDEAVSKAVNKVRAEEKAKHDKLQEENERLRKQNEELKKLVSV